MFGLEWNKPQQNRTTSRKSLTPKSSSRFHLEHLEDRLTPTTFTEIEVNDTIANANNVTIATGSIITAAPADWLNITAAVGSAGDTDFFRFNLGAFAGVFFDVDSRDTGLSATLDSVVTVFDNGGNQVAGGTNDNGYDFDGFAAPAAETTDGTSLDSSLYLDLAPGNYFVRVTGLANSTGNYQLRLLADANYSATVPTFASLPGATDTLFLDLDGHTATEADWNNGNQYTAGPYDFNANPAQYSPAEQLAIKNLYRTIAEDYSPFALNVTTIQPASFANGVGYRTIVTSSPSTIIGEPASTLGIAGLGSYTNDSVNTAFTFAESHPTYAAGGISGTIMARPLDMGNSTSHEFGHALNLNHIGSVPGGLMNTASAGMYRATWKASNTDPGGVLQDEMLIISSPENTIGYRTDDHGNTSATATTLTANNGAIASTGIISNLTVPDLDYFKFTSTTAGSATVTVSVDTYINNLNSVLRILDGGGNVLGVNDPPNSFGATLTVNLPAAGDYFIEVRSTGAPGEAGQYSISGTIPLGDPGTNIPPVVTAPASLQIDASQRAPLTGISVSDADAGAANVQLTSAGTGGTITLLTNVAGGITAGQITGNGTANVVVTAPLAAINLTLAATNGAVFQTTAAFNAGATVGAGGSVALTLSDLGNTGTGGAKTNSKTIAITDAPYNFNMTQAGTQNNDNIQAARYGVSPSDVLLIINGIVIGRFQSNGVTPITLQGLGGNDLITVDANLPSGLVLQGGAGDDSIAGGAGADTVDAGDGNDLVFGLAGADNIVGGIGNDSMDGGDGNDTIQGQAGFDYIVGGNGDDSLVGGDDNDGFDAGAGNDLVDGGAGNDFMYGFAGNDTMLGQDGADGMDAGAGADLVDGGAGNDFMYGLDGNDTMTGGDGNDGMDGGTGDDSMLGGLGNDLLFGNFGNDRAFGEAGNDSMDGNGGNDLLDGGSENDLIFASGGGTDTIIGGTGDDVLQNIDAQTTIFGGDGNDTIYGANFTNDSLLGEAGNDLFYGLSGNDTFVGGAGNDTADGGDGVDLFTDFTTGDIQFNIP